MVFNHQVLCSNLLATGLATSSCQMRMLFGSCLQPGCPRLLRNPHGSQTCLVFVWFGRVSILAKCHRQQLAPVQDTKDCTYPNIPSGLARHTHHMPHVRLMRRALANSDCGVRWRRFSSVAGQQFDSCNFIEPCPYVGFPKTGATSSWVPILGTIVYWSPLLTYCRLYL